MVQLSLSPLSSSWEFKESSCSHNSSKTNALEIRRCFVLRMELKRPKTQPGTLIVVQPLEWIIQLIRCRAAGTVFAVVRGVNVSKALVEFTMGRTLRLNLRDCQKAAGQTSLDSEIAEFMTRMSWTVLYRAVANELCEVRESYVCLRVVYAGMCHGCR